MTDPSHDLKGHFRDSRVPDRSFSHGSIVNSTSCKSVYLFSSHPFILMDFLYQLVRQLCEGRRIICRWKRSALYLIALDCLINISTDATRPPSSAEGICTT